MSSSGHHPTDRYSDDLVNKCLVMWVLSRSPDEGLGEMTVDEKFEAVKQWGPLLQEKADREAGKK